MDEKNSGMRGEFFGEGACIADMQGVGKGELDRLYSVAHRLYEMKAFKEAQSILEMLCLYNHKDPRFWVALGYCRKHLKNYSGALMALAYVEGHLPVLPSICVYLNMAECAMAIEDYRNASEYAKLALRMKCKKKIENKLRALLSSSKHGLADRVPG